ncbi:MAG: VOC family protein [Zoogloeaceae bacterium]|jgi:uncharacterized glyoxalase superfamily protein PhnB|nr:VOC family protein [Zoogloeaceae bacterium]
MLKKFWTSMMVDDIHATFAFYRDSLGFEHVMSMPAHSKRAEDILFEYDAGKPIIYALVRHGDIELMFQERKSLAEDVPVFANAAIMGGTLTFYFEVDDVDALAARLKPVCEVVRDMHDTFYGMREIYIRDLNGYVLCFGQDMTKSAS